MTANNGIEHTATTKLHEGLITSNTYSISELTGEKTLVLKAISKLDVEKAND